MNEIKSCENCTLYSNQSSYWSKWRNLVLHLDAMVSFIYVLLILSFVTLIIIEATTGVSL